MVKEDIEYYMSKFRSFATDNNKDIFIDIFNEFMKTLLEQDLSNLTLLYLHDIFIKDMNMYFNEIDKLEKIKHEMTKEVWNV